MSDGAKAYLEWVASLRRSKPAPLDYPDLSEPDKPAITTFPTGAVRSADVKGYAYHLIHPIALRRLAARCAMGAERYGKGNWEKGMPISDLADHVIAHIYKYLGGDRSDDHLAAALWGCHAMTVSEELWPELNRDLRPVVEPSK